MSPPTDPRIVVLGAGPTGLSTALGAVLSSSDSRVLVVEKGEKPGGLAGSFSWRGHTIDFGPHRLSPNLRVVRVIAEELLGPDCLINRSQHGVQFDGKLFQFPPRVLDWLSPGSLWHLAAFGWSYLAGKIEWVLRRFDRDTFETMINRKFGRRFHTLIAGPMAEKVWGPTGKIDPTFVSQRFTVVEPGKVLRTLVLPRQEVNPAFFYYPRLGYQQLWDNMAAYLARRGQSIAYSSVPEAVEVDHDRIVRVALRSPQGRKTVEGDGLKVVSTIPIMSLLSVMKGFPVEPLLERARAISVLSMALVSFEFDAPRTLPFRVHIFPEKRFCFNRLFEQNQYSRDTVAGGKSVITADITFARGGEKAGWSDERFVDEVRCALRQLPFLDVSRAAASHVERVEFAYMVPDVETRRATFEIQHDLKRISNLELMGRFSVGEYDNSDYAIEHGLTLGGMLCEKLSKLDYLCELHGQRGRIIVG